jgi:ribonuclease P protein subunit POP4
MSDDFDIDKFLNESFAKIEKKMDKKPKKIEKIVNKYSNEGKHIDQNYNQSDILSGLSNKETLKFNINDFNFEKIISSRIYEELPLALPLNFNIANSNVKLETVLKPLFPNEKVYESEFKNQEKNFILDQFIGKPKSGEQEIEKKNLPTSIKINKYKKIKESKLIKVLKEDKSLKFCDLKSMIDCWNEYIALLLNKSTQSDTITSKMLKADLHGALIQVSKSKNTNLNKLRGINLLETRRTFNLLCEDDKVRTILKRGSEFSIDLPYEEKKYSVKILGDNFIYKAVERSKAKYKNKYNL